MARGNGSMFKPKGTRYWHVRYSVAGKRRQESTGLENKTEARDYLRRKVAENRERPVTVTKALLAVGDDAVMVQYRNWLASEGTNTTGVDKVIRALARRPIGHLVAAHLTTARIQTTVNETLAEGLSRDTVALWMRYVRAALNWAAKRAGILRHVPFVPVPGQLHTRKGHYTEEEAEAIVQATPYRPAALCFDFLSWYGWRPVEPLRLRWWDRVPASDAVPMVVLHGEIPLIYLPKAKGGHEKLLPLEGRLLDLFRELRQLSKGSPWVFESPNRAGKALAYATLWGHFREAKAAVCGETDARTLYDLKRTAIRRLARVLGTRGGMTITGHVTPEMFDRYDVRNLDDQRAALQQLHGSHVPARSVAVVSQLGGVGPCVGVDLQGFPLVHPVDTAPRHTPQIAENTRQQPQP